MRSNLLLTNILVLLALPILSFSNAKGEEIKNFHKVDEYLYRSGQPQKSDMKSAQEKGIKTIINLRNVIDDKQEIKGTRLVQVKIPLRAKKLTYDDIVIVLNAIEASKKPVLIHCLHGSDRTGCMVAAYQILNGMSKEKAIEEFFKLEYGYNRKLFPNILQLLESIDVNQLKLDVPSN
jgi:uncharacterized protein (TIGR01244 family)